MLKRTLPRTRWQGIALCVLSVSALLMPSLVVNKAAIGGTVHRFNVRTFGAKGDGVTDDTAALNAAVTAAIAAGPGAKLFVPRGRYVMLHPQGGAHLHISGADGLTVQGENGSELLGDDPNAHIIALDNSKNTTIKNLTIGQDKYYFTQGTVVSQDPATHTVNLKLDDGYPEINAPQIVSIAHWTIHIVDPARPGPYEGPPYFTVAPLSEKRIGDRLWQLTFSDFHGWPAVTGDINIRGKKILIWDDRRGGHGISASRDSDCLVQDVVYYGKGVNAGLILYDCTGTMTFRRFVIGVPPGSQGLLSCSGGGQMIDIRGSLVFDHCDYQRFDDDGADILTNYARVHAQTAARIIVVEGHANYQAGDKIGILDWKTMQERATANIVSVTRRDDGDTELTLDRDVVIERAGHGDNHNRDTQVNDTVDRIADYNLACRSVIFRDCTFQCNRARPLNLKAQNCVVEGCDFFDCAWSAIEAGPEMWWGEAPSVHHLTIRNNRFIRNNGPDIDVGVFYDGEDKCTALDNRDIVIEGNHFEQYGSHGAIRVRNSQAVTIRNNVFSHPRVPLKPNTQIINTLHCQDITLEGNKGL